jgi:predicted aminopeptidase
LRQLKIVFIVIQIQWLSGCVNLPYYAQAVDGHIDVLRRSQSIQTIITDPDTDANLKRTLTKVLTLRKFASQELKLPDNKSYTRYADIKRPYAVWNVFATPELSIKLKKWCFIKAGCVSYRGFFSQTEAERFAEKLRNDGYDVHVGGVRAYSTLGWFNDPVLNTFIDYSELELARLIFHELSHQVAYAPGDTVFNESFATVVEQEGIKRWLEKKKATSEFAAYKAKLRTQTIFNSLVSHHRNRLAMLYSSSQSEAQKRAGKAHILNDLQEQFALLKTSRVEFNRYNRWFAQPMNNALLATVSIYTQLLPAFQALLAQQNGDMTLFFKVVKEISKLPKEERTSILQMAVDNHWKKDLVDASFSDHEHLSR